MREIKFRAWDTRNNKMHIDFMAHVELCTAEGFGNPWRSNQYVPMQYTGLKDKSGKEIYEGDIVQARLKTEFESYAPNIATVFFNNERAEFALEVKDDTQHQWGIHEGCEIIGNIYEHSHLLTNEKE